MKITQLTLHNVGRFTSLEVPIAPTSDNPSNVTVLVGNNGAGKTSILQALATSLSWMVSRIRSEKGSGSSLSENLITNESTSAAITLAVKAAVIGAEEKEYHWTLAKARSGMIGEYTSLLNSASVLANYYRTLLTQHRKSSLPLIAFYPVERNVLEIPLKIKNKHAFQQIDGYDHALNQGVDFSRFFEWFRTREDIENENDKTVLSDFLDEDFENRLQILADIVNADERVDKLEPLDFKGLGEEFKKLKSAIKLMQDIQDKSKEARDPQLNAVRAAIAAFMPGFEGLQVRRKPRVHMTVEKNGETLNVLQLSQGEKSLMALVGDIARRLAMMNPTLENPLYGQGVVLIDEVDMHLHPSWQRGIIDRLTTTFPHCQFILTTHSPLVISDCKNVLVYSLDDGELSVVPSLYGQDANSVLLDVMDTDIRNAKIATQLNDLLDLIQKKQLNQARSLLEKLMEDLPANNLELSKARLLLRKQELRIEKNHEEQ